MHLIDGRVKTISSHGGINLERGGGEMREGGEPKHEVASSVEGQPQGGRRNQSGMRTWSQALRALRGEVQGDG